jgi:hypothetical protein
MRPKPGAHGSRLQSLADWDWEDDSLRLTQTNSSRDPISKKKRKKKFGTYTKFLHFSLLSFPLPQAPWVCLLLATAWIPIPCYKLTVSFRVGPGCSLWRPCVYQPLNRHTYGMEQTSTEKQNMEGNDKNGSGLFCCHQFLGFSLIDETTQCLCFPYSHRTFLTFTLETRLISVGGEEGLHWCFPRFWPLLHEPSM